MKFMTYHQQHSGILRRCSNQIQILQLNQTKLPQHFLLSPIIYAETKSLESNIPNQFKQIAVSQNNDSNEPCKRFRGRSLRDLQKFLLNDLEIISTSVHSCRAQNTIYENKGLSGYAVCTQNIQARIYKQVLTSLSPNITNYYSINTIWSCRLIINRLYNSLHWKI